MTKVLDVLDQSSDIVLLSLKEEYYKDIINGRKKFEYRKKYKKDKTTAFVYISKTKKSVVSIIEFGAPIIGDSKEISCIAESESPGSFHIMMEYLDKGIGYAIPIKKVYEFEPISLSEINESSRHKFVAPQSYYMLNDHKEFIDIFINKNITCIYDLESKI